MSDYRYFNGLFYPYALKDRYSDWPDEGVDVGSDVFIAFTAEPPPPGKMIGSDEKGEPCWIDVKTPL